MFPFFRFTGKLLIGFSLLAGILAACQSTSATPLASPTPPLPPSPTTSPHPLLRVTNNGAVPIDDLVILFPDDRVEIGDVPAGATTGYYEVPNGIYRYAAYELQIDGEKVDLPVIDWVGEEPAPGEAFTYVLDLDPDRGRWEALQLVEVIQDK